MSTRYLTVDELKLYVRSEIAVDDAFYEAAINTAETIIDNTTGRRFEVASPTVSSARSYILRVVASSSFMTVCRSCRLSTTVRRSSPVRTIRPNR